MKKINNYFVLIVTALWLGLLSGSVSAQSTGSEKSKSAFQKRYMLYSFVVPGLGEYMMDETDYLKYFITADVILLLGAYSLDYYSNSLISDAVNFAKQRAGISGAATDRGFLIALGNYNSLAEYNNKMMQDRYIADLYPENDTYHWQWQSTDDRYTYERKRQDSELLKQSIPFVVGAIIVNHTVSMFNVLLLYKKSKKETAEKTSTVETNIWANPTDQANRFGKGIQLNVQFSF